MRVLITGGGTGGHCTPAIAVAEALRQTDPKGAVTYVGRADGPESRLVPGAGLEFVGLTLGSMGSSRLTATPRLLTRMPLAYLQARRVVNEFRPDVVLATGGYVSVPVALVAGRRGMPVVLLEQNELPGRAVEWLARRAAVVATSFPGTAAHLPGARVVCTGNPVRSEFSALAGPVGPPELAQTLLVMGGSQGARHLNQVLLEALPGLLSALPGLAVTHLTGPGDHERVLAEAAASGLGDSLRYRPLAFEDHLMALLAGAGLVVMRAGGSSLAEAACLGKPMVLVPYPHAGNHQAANAQPFSEAGAAVVVEDSELTSERLIAEVCGILGDSGRRDRMAGASRALARPGAAMEVVQLLTSLAHEGG
ncbi:MAG: undecaprenyldiphospho-muramoylpentapeptide beta-N-acetylglucosaminyltransferase [Candidatus Dormibacteria bacterium]